MLIDNLIQIAYILVVAICSAIGVVSLLLASIELLPLAISKGWRWFALTAAPYFTAIILYNAPKYLFLPELPRKLILIIVLLLFAGPFYFCWRFRADASSVRQKLIIGLILLIIATALLYGFADDFISLYIKSQQKTL